MKPVVGKRYRWTSEDFALVQPFRITEVNGDTVSYVYDDGTVGRSIENFGEGVNAAEEVGAPAAEQVGAPDDTRRAAVLLVALMSRIQNAAALGIDLGLKREKFIELAGDCYDSAEFLIEDAEKQFRGEPRPAR